MQRNIIKEKTIEFSLLVIEFTELLERNRKFIVGNQLLKAATSIGANVHEAQCAESKADFVHKMKIAAKEAEETGYWLLLCSKSTTYPRSFLPINSDSIRLILPKLNLDH